MPELSRRRRFLILGICCLSLLIVGMDNSIVNIALTSIHQDLGASLSGLQWTIDAYTVVLASLLMFAGSTADRLGRRRLFQIGLGVFALGSLLCSLAPTLGWLIAFRVVQAVGGSMLNPVALSIVTNVFTEPKERARAIGVWGSVVGLSIGLGPVVGGSLIDAINWRAIFWVNIPIGLAALVLTALYVPESRAAHPRRPDPVGQLLIIALLAGSTFAIIESPRWGWTSPDTLVAGGIAVVALVALLAYEPQRAEPLLDLRFFRSVPFAGATVIAVCSFAAYSGFLFLNTLYLQEVRGLRPLVAGVCTLPIAAMTAVLPPISGRIVASRGARIPMLLAGLLLCVGAVTLVPLSASESYWWLTVSYLVFGAGFGLVNAPITNTAVSGMPREQAGTAAAVASTSRQVGATLGVAIIGTVLASQLNGPLPTGFVAASRAAWWVIAVLGLAVLAFGLLSTGRRADATAQRTARLMAEERVPVLAD
ncbi:MFS transporter [uncultured Jatrophihabitans sp.]|uniref:MFS transporter n=1 Tax=uncultured Jatrophihabitans sp. TaxID=1610747 RepID=UPI0035CA3233